MSPLATVDYCVALHKQNSEQLGFIPRSRIEYYAHKGLIWTASEGGDYCGYLLGGVSGRWARIYQACVELDLRRLSHGEALVNSLIADVTKWGATGLTLRCRQSNEAVAFWQALGFEVIRTLDVDTRRGKPLLVFAKQIGPDLLCR